MAERNLLKMIWENFINSLKPKRFWGDLRGKDYFGNTYFEIPPQGRSYKPARYFKPPSGKDFTNEIPAEWESWLRHRRKLPPTDDELQYNLSIMQMKKENATKLEAQRILELESQGLPTALTPPEKGRESYPKYEEYDGGDMSRHKK